MPKPPLREQKKMRAFDKNDPSGYPLVRVKHHPQHESLLNSYVIQCGCCREKLEIYYDKDSLEINGVEGSLKNWRAVLLPLLGINPKDMSTKEQAQAKRTLARLRRKYPRP